jgi:RNA polymerase sigma factor (sigma-70 family)
MDTLLKHSIAEQDRHISATFTRERARLKNFIRQRVPDAAEAEDILQDVFYEFVAAYRLPLAIERVGAWLFQVARNRIIDRFRKKRESSLYARQQDDDDDGETAEALQASSSSNGPEAAYARSVLAAELYAALEQLPRDQREVFIAHELEGRSFKQLAAESGVNINTLLARKRYALVHLRTRLQAIYDEFNLTEQES